MAGWQDDPVETAPQAPAQSAVAYDDANDLGRNPDGSVAFVQNPNAYGVTIEKSGAGYNVASDGVSRGAAYSSNPAHIKAYLAAHPDVPAIVQPSGTGTGSQGGSPDAAPPDAQAGAIPSGQATGSPALGATPSWQDDPVEASAPITTAVDVARGALAGTERGAVGSVNSAAAAIPELDMVRKAVGAGADLIAPLVAKAFGLPADTIRSVAKVAGSNPSASMLPGGNYQPTTTPGQYAETAGEFLPAAAFGEGGIPSRAMQVLAPAVASETGGQIFKNGPLETPARLIAALVAGGMAGPKMAPAPNTATLGATADATLAGFNTSRASLPTDIRAQIDAAIAKGRDPQQAAVRAVADSLPVKVPLTLGQERADPAQQLFENLSLRGSHGADAQRMMAGHVVEQQAALRGNTSAIAERLAGTTPPERGRGGVAVSEELNRRFDASKRGVDQAYREAREAGADQAHLSIKEGPKIAGALRESVREFDPDTVPAVTRELNKLDGLGTLTARDLFEARSRLTHLRMSDAVTAKAASSAVHALDREIDRAIADDLFTGDPKAVGAWRKAIAARRDHGTLFEGQDLIAALTKQGRHGEGSALKVDPADAANFILGKSALGAAGKRNLYRDVSRLQKVLGPDSAAWNSLRAEVFQRIAGVGEGPAENGEGQFSGAKFSRGWSNFQATDPRLASRLFSEDERNVISRFAKVASRATTPLKGGDNVSNSGVLIMRAMHQMPFMPWVRGIPFIGEHFVEGVEHGIALAGTSRAINPKLAAAVKALPRLVRAGPAMVAATGQLQRTP